MTTNLIKAYRKHRKNTGGWVGHNAEQSLNAAKTDLLWSKLEFCNLVKIEIEPDDCPDLSYLDQTDDEMGRGFERSANAERERAGDYGVWTFSGWYRHDSWPRWEIGDSVGGFIANDYLDSGYDTDVKAETIKCLREDLKRRCKECRR